jgi:hypothetical protein
VRKSERTGKQVTFFLNSSFYHLQGNWQWEMANDAIFCSDVMFSPAGFVGTRAIFYPDDLLLVKKEWRPVLRLPPWSSE